MAAAAGRPAGQALTGDLAWTLRTQPTLAWKASPAFPAWAAAALAAAMVFTLTPTPAGQLIGLQPAPAGWLLAVATMVLAATAASRAITRTPLLTHRL